MAGDYEASMRYKAVIFDLDGTLINSLEDLADSANEALNKFGYSSHPTDAYKLFIGNGIKQLIKNAAPAGTPDTVLENILAEYRIIYNRNYINKTIPYENTEKMLNSLRELGINMGVCSNKSQKPTVELVGKLLGSQYFEVVFGEREGIPRKPDPAALLEAARLMGVSPSEAIYIGDSGGDMVAARNAGMYAAGALWGFRSREELEENGAQVLLSKPMDLVDFIQI